MRVGPSDGEAWGCLGMAAAALLLVLAVVFAAGWFARGWV